jgi:hypothetical protein
MTKWTLGHVEKNKAKQTQFKPNTNPIQSQYKPNSKPNKPNQTTPQNPTSTPK